MSSIDKTSVDEIFSSLEKVFSGSILFDEALMDLGVFSAQVRKTYPSLYKVLSSVGSTEQKSTELGSSELSEVKALLVKLSETTISPVAGTAHISIPAAPAPPKTEEVLDPANYPDYNAWATSSAKSSNIGDEHIVKWDTRVVLPSVGGPLTVRTDLGRKRFTVVYVDGNTRLIKLKHLVNLPLND